MGSDGGAVARGDVTAGDALAWLMRYYGRDLPGPQQDQYLRFLRTVGGRVRQAVVELAAERHATFPTIQQVRKGIGDALALLPTPERRLSPEAAAFREQALVNGMGYRDWEKAYRTGCYPGPAIGRGDRPQVAGPWGPAYGGGAVRQVGGLVQQIGKEMPE